MTQLLGLTRSVDVFLSRIEEELAHIAPTRDVFAPFYLFFLVSRAVGRRRVDTCPRDPTPRATPRDLMWRRDPLALRGGIRVWHERVLRLTAGSVSMAIEACARGVHVSRRKEMKSNDMVIRICINRGERR